MKIRIIKEVKTYDRPEVGKVYNVIGSCMTRWGRFLLYIEVNGNPVGLKTGEYEVV